MALRLPRITSLEELKIEVLTMENRAGFAEILPIVPR